MEKCNVCGKINKVNAKFCIKCGKQLSNFTPLCPYCKNIITPDDVFCKKCGKSIKKSGSKQETAKKETYKYIKKPIAATGRNRNFKIFLGLIGGFTAVVVIAIILIFVLGIGNLATPFKFITKTGGIEEPSKETATTKEEEEDGQISELSKEVPTDNKLSPAVDSITPGSGTLGTMIQIKGSNLGSSGLKSVSLGEHELIINAVSNDIIEVHISYGAQSGNIVLTFEEEKIDAGVFEVLPQQKQLLLENEIGSSTEPQTVSADNIAVTIPGSAIDKTQTIRIERIADPQPINLPQSAQFTSFSITLGDMHQFNDIITIEYMIPSDAQGEPSAAYFDEATSLWDTLPSEVIDGKLYIYTDHLTDIGIFYWGKSIYSSDGFFKIYYHADDVTKFAGSMDELAIKVGDALEKIKKDYEKKIPAGYREDFSFMGFTDSMDVYIDSDYFAAKYNPLTNNLLLPTEYTGIDDFETVLAHEFFHSYQDSVWNEISYIGKMGKSENIWAVEALAELAAYELAYPDKKRERLINNGVSSQDPHYTFDEIHEYSMSCFLRYLLRDTNSKFEELWIYVASSGTSKIEYSINEFFRSKSTDFISLGESYTKFWRGVLGNADAPKQLALDSLIEIKNLKINEHSAIFKYQTGNIETTAFNMLKVTEFSENMPVRIFNMEFIDGSNSGVWSTQISGVKNINAITDLRISGGRNWNYSSTAGDSSSGSFERYVFKKGSDDVVLIALDCLLKNELSGVKISEIQAQCKPAKIEDASVGKEYEFELEFKDIFKNATNVVIEVDFGDGEVVEYQEKNENGMLSSNVKHVFSKPGNTPVKCSLYDVSQQDKVLISQLYVPVVVGELELTLSVNPNPVTLGEAVSLSTNITNKDYRYKWDLSDGTILDEVGLYKTEHIYSLEGDYTISVEVYNEKDELVGKTEATVTVYLELMLSVNPNPVTLGEVVSFSTNITNGDYTYKWNLGDGTKLDKVGLYKTEHIYSLEGDYPISIEIYNGKGELVGKAAQNVTVAPPEVTETTISNSEIVGTWIYQEPAYFYSDNSVSYLVVTFVLKDDGTCSYLHVPVVLREPSETIEYQEQKDLEAIYGYRKNPGYHPYEYESGQGTYVYFGKGHYFEENKVGAATILLTTASSQYEYGDFIWLMDGKLVFMSTPFTKK